MGHGEAVECGGVASLGASLVASLERSVIWVVIVSVSVYSQHTGWWWQAGPLDQSGPGPGLLQAGPEGLWSSGPACHRPLS